MLPRTARRGIDAHFLQQVLAIGRAVGQAGAVADLIAADDGELRPRRSLRPRTIARMIKQSLTVAP